MIKLALAASVLLGVAGISIYRSREAGVYGRGSAVPQPIPFSHKHHAGDDGIDCRYCHTTVEKSGTAGLPSTDICLTCHSQLYRDAPLLEVLRQSAETGRPVPWQRVHDLPDFVYFDHSIHVRKGVSCGECHGPVEQMPLTWRHASLEMQWCLECHRAPAGHLHPNDEVFSGVTKRRLDPQQQQALVASRHLQSVRRLTDCSTCHR
ncbi:MAG: cytochrome c3 family protein [Bacteroidota bacterium]